MKLKWLIPVSAVTLVTGTMPLVACGKKETNSLTWDFVKNQGYESQVKQKVPTQAYNQDEALKAYLKDVKDNPLILADDLMFTDAITYWGLYEQFGKYMSTFTTTISDIDVDADKGLFSLHYVCHIKVDTVKSHPEMNLDIDFTYKNIAFMDVYYLYGIQTIDLSTWYFGPQYLYGMNSPQDLATYFKTLTNDWSIKGTYFSDIVTNGEYASIEVNLDKDHCVAGTDIKEETCEALEHCTPAFGSMYFANIPCKADYDLVYDGTKQCMKLDPKISMELRSIKFLSIDLSKFVGDIKPILQIKMLNNGTLVDYTTSWFTGRFGKQVLDVTDFNEHGTIGSWYYTLPLNLTKSDKIFISLEAVEELTNFDFQISFIDQE